MRLTRLRSVPWTSPGFLGDAGGERELAVEERILLLESTARHAPAVHHSKAKPLLAVARILRQPIEARVSQRLFAEQDSRILRELCNAREFAPAIRVAGVFGHKNTAILHEFMRASSPAQSRAFVSVIHTEQEMARVMFETRGDTMESLDAVIAPATVARAKGELQSLSAVNDFHQKSVPKSFVIIIGVGFRVFREKGESINNQRTRSPPK
jgi:hypothetical protein